MMCTDVEPQITIGHIQ